MLSALLTGLQTPALADVDSDSNIRRLAGQPVEAGFGGDGEQAFDATLIKPRDSEFGPDGSLYIVDTFNDRVRKIAPDGTISTVAGNGEHGYNGDEIPATEASLSWPHDLFVDDQGNMFIADSNNQRIRKVSTDGIIHTVVGTGDIGSTGDGDRGRRAEIKFPKTVFRVGSTLYWAGFENRVRKVDLTTDGVVSAVAGSIEAGYLNGPADQAQFNRPQRMQIDSAATSTWPTAETPRLAASTPAQVRSPRSPGPEWRATAVRRELRRRSISTSRGASSWRGHVAVHRRQPESAHPAG